MSNLYVYTLFDPRNSYPICTGIKDGEKVVIVELYRKGSGITIKQVHKNCDLIKRTILQANRSGRSVILSDFKSHIKQFDLPLKARRYNVYDLHLPEIRSTGSQRDNQTIRKILEKMAESRVHEYQKILANAAVVYQDLENNGLLMNYTKVKPVWSQKTFSGRSSTTGFNIQGYHNNELIRPVGMPEDSVLIHFDWICADIRAASLISGDEELGNSFTDSDPYSAMMVKLNADAVGTPMNRLECKRYLLRSINSMDVTSDALLSIYPILGDWISMCKKIIKSPNSSLETILNRKFRKAQAKNDLAVLNGVMQGSVAHAMQLVIRHIWEKVPGCLVAEIHDSLVVCSSPDSVLIRKTIDMVSDIMLHPFRDTLLSNPAFPFKVSIGKRWKKWKTIYVYREKGVECVVQQKAEARKDES